MDNLTEALYMSFSIMIFVIALGLSLMLFRNVQQTAEIITKGANRARYYEYFDFTNILDSQNTAVPKLLERRTVKESNIIPVLYRYSRETMKVSLYTKDMKLYQIFYSSLDKSFAKREQFNETGGNDKFSKYEKSIYDKFNKKVPGKPSPAYLYKAPWGGSLYDNQKRVEYFIHGQKGYIGTTLVDYTEYNLKKLTESGTNNDSYEEIVFEYMTNGKVLLDEEYIDNKVHILEEVIEKFPEKLTEIIYIKK